MINFLKGVGAGIGNILPGISGSALMVIFGLYEKCIVAISEISKLKNLKKNILFLMPIALGIVVGTVLFSNVIKSLLAYNEFLTSMCFLGLIIGTIPFLFKEANKEGFKSVYIIAFVVALLFGLFLGSLNSASSQLTSLTWIQGVILGAVYAVSTLLPGVSSTVLFNMMGYYDMYINVTSNPFTHITEVIFIGIGFVTVALLLANIINYLLKNYYGYCYYAICGFVFATLPEIVRGYNGINTEFFIGVLITFISVVIAYLLTKINKEEKTA